MSDKFVSNITDPEQSPVDLNAGAPTSAQAPQAPAAAQPQAPGTTFSPTVMNAQPTAAPKPPDQHDYFRSILGILAGGSRKPVMGPDGKPVVGADGNVVTTPMTKSNLGAGILAGALSSMMAGFQHLPERNGNGVMQTHLNDAAQAGAQAGEANTSAARLQGAQKVSDEDRARQYQTMKQNLDMHALSLSVDSMDTAAKDAFIARFTPLYEGMQNFQYQGKPIIAGENESEPELTKRVKESGGDVTRDSAIPTGQRPEIGTDGKPTGRVEVLWTSFHNGGVVTVSEDMRKLYGLDPSTVGQTIPIRSLVQRGLNTANSVFAGKNIDAVVKTMNDYNKANKSKGPKIEVDWDELRKTTHVSKQQEQQIAGLAAKTSAPDEFVAAISGINPALGAALQEKLQINYDDWANKRVADKKASENEEARQLKKDEASDVAASPKGQADLAHVQAQTKKLQEDAKNMTQKDADQDELAAQLIRPDNLTAMRDIGGRGNDRAAIMAKAQRAARAAGIPFDAGLINRRVDFLKEYENPNGTSAKQRGQLNNLMQHAGDLQDVNDEYKRFGAKFLNTPVNKLKDQIGNEAFVHYQTVNAVLKDELSLFFAGGYAPNKEQQATWDKIQSDNATPDATIAFAKEVARLAVRRIDTTNEAFKTMMGYNDPNLISPAGMAAGQHLDAQVAKMLSKYGSGGQLGSQPQGGQPQAGGQSNVLEPAGRDTTTGNAIGWDGKARRFVDMTTGRTIKQY